MAAYGSVAMETPASSSVAGEQHHTFFVPACA